jgi:hypothetical protein
MDVYDEVSRSYGTLWLTVKSNGTSIAQRILGKKTCPHSISRTVDFFGPRFATVLQP